MDKITKKTNIFRSTPESNFVMISNELAQHPTMTRRSKGLLVELLSRPADWSTSASRLVKRDAEGKSEKGEGLDAIRSCLRELESLGYVKYEKNKDIEGKWSSRLTVFDTPQNQTAGAKPIRLNRYGKSRPITKTDLQIQTVGKFISETSVTKEEVSDIDSSRDSETAKNLYNSVFKPAGRGLSTQKKSTVIASYEQALISGITAVRLTQITPLIIAKGDFITDFSITQAIAGKGKYLSKAIKGELKADKTQDWMIESPDL